MVQSFPAESESQLFKKFLTVMKASALSPQETVTGTHLKPILFIPHPHYHMASFHGVLLHILPH